MINLLPVSTAPTITKNPWQGLIAGVKDSGDNFFDGVVDTAHQLIAGVVEPGINIHSRISPRIFEKIQNDPNGILGGLGDTDS